MSDMLSAGEPHVNSTSLRATSRRITHACLMVITYGKLQIA